VARRRPPTRAPWSTAQPWLTHNLVRGEALQNSYQDSPFNALQQASYGNLLKGNDYINQMVPGLLSQMSQPAGFDRNNPRARPAPFSFPGMSPGNYQPVAGLLGASTGQMNTQANPWAQTLQPFGGGIPGGAQAQPAGQTPAAMAQAQPGPAQPPSLQQQPMSILDWANTIGAGNGGY
jgi:hypothetical protein